MPQNRDQNNQKVDFCTAVRNEDAGISPRREKLLIHLK